MPIDPSQFSVNEKPDEYTVIVRVVGEIRLTINAESPSAAKSKVYDLIATDDESAWRELDDFDDISVDHVYKTPAMYRVIRDGKPMQVSHLNDGDLPREPDERGF